MLLRRDKKVCEMIDKGAGVEVDDKVDAVDELEGTVRIVRDETEKHRHLGLKREDAFESKLVELIASCVFDDQREIGVVMRLNVGEDLQLSVEHEHVEGLVTAEVDDEHVEQRVGKDVDDRIWVCCVLAHLLQQIPS